MRGVGGWITGEKTMARDREKEREYQRKYYEEHIKNNKEKREKKNARQREYAKRRGYAGNAEYNKKTYKSYTINLRIQEDAEYIEMLENEKAKGKGTSEIFREILSKFLENEEE